MPIKKRNLKNKNKNTFYRKKKVMKGGKDMNQYENNEEEENKYVSNHSGLLGVLEQASGIFNMGASVIVNKATKMLNLDLSQIKDTSSEDITNILREKIKQINEALKDPETMAEMKEFARILGENGGIVLEAASPSIKKALFKLIEIITAGSIKLGQSMIKLILDVAGTIPVFGVVIEGIRVLDDIVKAFQASQIAYLEAQIASADTVTETIRRFKDMVDKYKGQTQGSNTTMNSTTDVKEQRGGALTIKKRITNSISKFHKTNRVIKRRNKRQTRKRKTHK